MEIKLSNNVVVLLQVPKLPEASMVLGDDNFHNTPLGVAFMHKLAYQQFEKRVEKMGLPLINPMDHVDHPNYTSASAAMSFKLEQCEVHELAEFFNKVRRPCGVCIKQLQQDKKNV